MMLAAIIAGIGASWLSLRLVRRLERNGRGWWWVILPVFGVVAVGFLYGEVEFIRNKGPDDWGAVFHSAFVLREKYGSSTNPKLNMTDYSYAQETSVYRFHYRCAGELGVIVVHLDNGSGKFDHDEIVPNP